MVSSSVFSVRGISFFVKGSLDTFFANACGFAYVLRLLRTFVYSFCVRICLFCTFVFGFCACCADFLYVYGFSFVHVVQLLRTYTSFVRVERILRTYTAYLLQCSIRTFSRDPILRVPRFLLSVRTLVICGQSQGSGLEGSVNFFVCASCFSLFDSLKDPILRFPSTSLYARAARDSPSDLNLEVSFCSW